MTVLDCPDPSIPSTAWFRRTADGHALVGCRRRGGGDVTRRDEVTWRLECDSRSLQWKRDVTEMLRNCSSRKYVNEFAAGLSLYVAVCVPVFLFHGDWIKTSDLSTFTSVCFV